MSVGIRVRGGAGQVQIDDRSPCYVVLESGTYSSANVEGSGSKSGVGNNAYFNRHVIYFVTPVTSQEAPLIFLKLGNYSWMCTCQTEGSAGNWTGFSVGLGFLTSSQVSFQASAGSWFSAGLVPAKSNARIGVRVRNPTTGQIVYDSGYKLVRFIHQASAFQAEGRVSHDQPLYSVGYPADAYFLGNFTGLLERRGKGGVQQMAVCTNVQYPNKIFLVTFTNNDEIAYQYYMWTVLFGVPGN